MPVTYKSELRRPYFPGHRSSYLELIPEEELEAFAALEEFDATSVDSAMTSDLDQMAAAKEEGLKSDVSSTAVTPAARPSHKRQQSSAEDYLTAGDAGSANGLATPGTPMSRTTSSGDIHANFEAFGQSDFPPVDRLTMFDILENLALPQRLERMQHAIHDNAEKLRRQRARLATRAMSSRNNIVEEWRKRVHVAPDERLERYRARMRKAVDRIGKRWNDSKTVTLMEKVSFVTAVLNIFVSAYLCGAYPQYFHYWYTLQLAYFMPLRWYRYYSIGFHYFLADLCYFTNFLLILSIWFFPQSKRLLISTYCLAFGNNAVAIAMWRNSLVFHSFDKTTTLFIHIMPCATLHVLVHLIPKEMQLAKFPAIHTIKYSASDAPEHYGVLEMILWATLPYAIWQLSYHFLITVRKRAKIAAGRPTSFTWLRRSYRGNALGKFVLSFPDHYQEPVFMCIQYVYALLTMLPCPIWFWYMNASAGFMTVVFAVASWNGATYYIDVFGKRMEKELDALRKEVARMAKSPEIPAMHSLDALATPGESTIPNDAAAAHSGGAHAGNSSIGVSTALDLGPAAQEPSQPLSSDVPNHIISHHSRGKSTDSISLMESTTATDDHSLDDGLDDDRYSATNPGAITPGLELKRTLDGGIASLSDMHFDSPNSLADAATKTFSSSGTNGPIFGSELPEAGADKKNE